MSHLECKCGYTMSSTSCPSPNLMDVFSEKEIMDAIQYNPDLRWLDLLVNWDETKECKKYYMQRPEPVEYWFCTRCKRAYEVSIPRARWVRVYRCTKNVPQDTQVDWKTIFVFPELETDPYTEENGDILVSELVYHVPHPYSFRCSEDEKTIVAYDSKTKAYAFTYELEEYLPPPSKED